MAKLAVVVSVLAAGTALAVSKGGTLYIKVKGFTLQQNLSPKKPQAEFLAKDDGKPIDAQAFASSGAATKALSGAALKYSGSKPDLETLAKQLMTAEGAAAAVTVEAAREFNAKQVGGAK